MLVISGGQTLSALASPGYIIKNPEQMVNKFTITEAEQAADTLELWHHEKISELKTFLKDYDMTSISTSELRIVGRRLFESDVINSRALLMFSEGIKALDDKGRQTNHDAKFNAIALFNERLEEQIDFFEKNPRIARSDGAADYLQGMVRTNHVINALAYFVKSSKSELSIDEQA